jgi:hypothetical protein
LASHFKPLLETITMTRPDLTDITLVLDRSGSMASIKDATIEAFNGFLGSQLSGVGTACLTLVQFDDQYEVVYEAVPLPDAPPLTADTFVPRGSTALLDAIGRTINTTGERFHRMPESERPGNVLFVTLTDGEENASRKFCMEQINSMICHQRETYSWHFVFLAANQDAIASAAQMGIGAGDALTLAASGAGVHASMNALKRKAHGIRQGAPAATLDFMECERAAAMPDSPKSKKK